MHMITMILACSLLGQFNERSKLELRPDEMDPIIWHVSDPAEEIPWLERELKSVENPRDRQFAEGLVRRLGKLQSGRTVELSLKDALRRALANSYAIRVQSYFPAITTTGVVQAEAAFDAVYSMNLTKDVRDVPSASQLAPTEFDTFFLQGGFAKRLATGATVQTSLQIRRQFIDLQFQLLNPEYTSAFSASITQPLLRGAGLDRNLAPIRIAKKQLDISREAFRRQVREILFSVERAYWDLVRARRRVSISARLLTEFEKIYDYLDKRRDFDVFQIQLSQTEADLQTEKARFIEVVNNVRDAEDRLLGFINDPELNLADDIEIVTVDFPSTMELDIDRLAEVQTALDRRSELREARWGIDIQKLQLGIAKNEALPQLDVAFTYTVDGLGSNFDDAFDQVTQTDFTQYLVTLRFEVPVGNRLREAELRREQLEHAQAIASLKAQIEDVIREVNLAARAIDTSYKQIEPRLASAEANEDQVAAIIARAERKDFQTLNQELGARRSVAASRNNLLDALITFKIAVAALERAKGTLLDYNNVEIAPQSDFSSSSGAN